MKLIIAIFLKTQSQFIKTKEMNFDSLIERLKFSTVNLVNLRQQQYRRIRESYILKNPLKILDNKSQKYLQLLSKLEPLSPLLTLERGYTITKKEDKAVNFVSDVGRVITLQLSLGMESCNIHSGGSMQELKINRIYKHFKGNYYLVLGLAKDSETGEDVVIYRQLYDDCSLFVRPLKMFLGKVDKEKYPDVEQIYRFELQDIKSNIKK